ADVSDKLLLQFVDNLNVLIASGSGATPSAPAQSAPDQPAPAPTVRKIEHTEDVAPLDLLDAAGGTIAKRLVPVVIIVGAAVAAFLIFR
ncbi:MAG: hypothetical protein ACKOIZ_00680, partial [Actinomycetota bacterium]